MIYALLIYSRASEQTPMSEKSLEASLVEHRALQADTVRAGKLIDVAQLQDPVDARTVRISGTGHVICDGPYLEAKEWLAGFYLLECANQQEALTHAQRIVTSDVHCVEVRPVGWHRHEL